MLIKKFNSFLSTLELSKQVHIGEEEQAKMTTLMDLSPRGLNRSVNAIRDNYEVELVSPYDEILFWDSSAICWTHEDEEFTYGGFQINGIRESLCAPSTFWYADFSIAIDEDPPEELKHFEEINWFEKQAWGDDGRYGCIIREKGTFPPKMSFYDKGWSSDMSLNLIEYIDAMYDSCGIKGWQYFYVEIPKDHPNLKDVLEEMEKSVRLLPKIFPERDFSYHKARLEDIKNDYIYN